MKRFVVLLTTTEYEYDLDLLFVDAFDDWLDAVRCCHNYGSHILDNKTTRVHYSQEFNSAIEKTLADFAWYMLPDFEPEPVTIYIYEGGVLHSNRSLTEEIEYQEKHKFDLTEEDKEQLRDYESTGGVTCDI